MLEAVQEAKYISEAFRTMNYEVIEEINPSNKQMVALMKRLMAASKEAIKKGERILIHVYYTGHGKMKD